MAGGGVPSDHIPSGCNRSGSTLGELNRTLESRTGAKVRLAGVGALHADLQSPGTWRVQGFRNCHVQARESGQVR
jgi:hypothetical protein